MKHPASLTLFEYWNDLRAGRLAPRRFEIEPSSIAAILPDTLILERIEPAISRFRLAGTRVSEAFGIEFRGVNFIDLFSDTDRQTVQRQLSVSARQGAVCRFEFTAVTSAGLEAPFELVLLPLTHTRDVIDRFVGTLTALDRPMWIGSVPLTIRKLTDSELIWPDGRPHALIDNAVRQTPFMPHIREARVVRFDRRSFRVYDGGLSGDNNDKS